MIKRLIKSKSLFLSALAPMLLASSAFAAGEKEVGMMNVTARIGKACTVQVTPLAFGTYTTTQNSNSLGTIIVNCTLNTDYITNLNNGVNYDTTSQKRRMSNNKDGFLAYDLYSNQDYTTLWTSKVGKGTSRDETITVFGQIPSGQTSPDGNYADIITVSVNF